MTNNAAASTEKKPMPIHELFAYLRVRDAAKAIEFYKAAFGATEKYRLSEPSGRIGHCELDFDGTIVMVSEEYPEMNINGPETVGGTTFSLHLHVDDADAMMARAAKAGAKVVRAPTDQFYGERSGTLRDPFGHEWMIGHSIEKVTPEEMQRRYNAMMKQG
jgi:PhnB protein